MIKEDYVSFEIAKLLKEKGFDVYGDGSYGSSIKVWMEYSPFGKIRDISTTTPSIKGFPAPTLQMAMKWLREIHNIHIVTSPFTDVEGHNFSFMLYKYAYGCWHELAFYITNSWNSYEEACEAAIKYCLENLI